MLEFHKEDDGEGFFSVHVSDGNKSELLAMCPSERYANVLLRVLREGLSERSKEMEADQTSTYKEPTPTTQEATPTTQEAVNETSLIKLTTNRNGLRLISSNY